MYSTDWAEYPAGATWALMEAELTGVVGGAGVLNADANTNVLGEEGPIEYMKQAVLDAIVAKSDGTEDVDYSYVIAAAPAGFTVTVTATIGGKVCTFTVSAGGIINISES